MSPDELDVKITLRSVVKIVAAVAAVVGMWTTMVLGQQDNTRRLERIETHVATIDSTLTAARQIYQTRAELQLLLRQADSTHAAMRYRLENLENRLSRVKIY